MSRVPSSAPALQAVLDDGSAAASRGLPLATELARSLRAALQILHASGDDAVTPLPHTAGSVLCVMPSQRATSARLRRAPYPLLLVA